MKLFALAPCEIAEDGKEKFDYFRTMLCPYMCREIESKHNEEKELGHRQVQKAQTISTPQTTPHPDASSASQSSAADDTESAE